MAEKNSGKIIEQLQDMIQKHRVFYKVWPEYLIMEGKQVQVGFTLDLCETHEHEDRQQLPECQQCPQTFKDLEQVVDWLMPKEKHAPSHRILRYGWAWCPPPKRWVRPEVVLTIKISHGHGFDRPVNGCQEFCLTDMRQKLAELGVAEGSQPSDQR